MNLLAFLTCVLAYYILNVTSNSLVKERKPIKLTMKQGLLINQVIGTYALSEIKTAKCKNHTEEFKEGLRAFEPWALQMFDSSSKVQSGILSGNLMEYGAFEQCTNIYKGTNKGVIRGKHCTIHVIPGTKLIKTILAFRNVSEKRFEKVKTSIVQGVKLVWSVCIPATCTVKDILPHFNKSIREITEGLDLTVEMKEENCVSLENRPEFTTKHYCFLTIAVGILAMICVCSLLELKGSNSNRLVNAFSIVSNGRRLIAKGKGGSELDCPHGIRFISVCYVMFGHRFMSGMLFPTVNSLDLLDWILKYTSTIIIGGTICVDSFFLVSGTLVSYILLDKITKTRRFHLLHFYVHRYIRITPSVIVAVIYYSSFIQFLGTGPLYYDTVEGMQKPCQHFWWSTILHIQPLTNPKHLCIPQTWYLACDTCYYYLSPLIVYPLWRWPTFGLFNLAVCYILSVGNGFYIAWINEYVGGMPLTQQLFDNRYFQQYYIQPHIRSPPYIIGLGLGYAIYKTKGRKINIGLGMNLAGWCLTIIFMSSAVVGSHVFQEEQHDYNRLESCLFLALSRSGWVLGIVWIIWTCIHGYSAVVNYILSLHIFRVLGRVGYGIFLFHMSLQFLKEGSAKMPAYYSNFLMMYNCCADLLIMSIVGTLFTLCFEYPIMGIEVLLLTRKSPITTTKVQSPQKDNEILSNSKLNSK